MICTPHRTLFESSNQTRVVLAGNVACTGEGRCAYRILVGIPEGKRSVGRRTNR